MTLLVLTHVISTFILFLFFIIWIILDYKLINLNKIIILFKAVVVTLLSSSLYWLPAIKLVLMNKLIRPFNMGMPGVNSDIILKDSLFPLKLYFRFSIYTLYSKYYSFNYSFTGIYIF
ncbi:hypothetical protein WR164_03330 [Philodulcilactobacillus myokoensis]|uniref:Uncharacterized protein n=1 Tax=Philodulcilactobacillus myokoensis TaxID=2929573 RepID=A0A9W6AZK9_9LACO|nr:hypothetical protein WR164_03330 [Philodulcilactobacillus myokoensis]